MLRIRLSRTGRKNLNLFRVVVAEQKAPIKGRFIEILGNFNPNAKLVNFKINEKRLKYWLSVGAQPTDTVTNLLVNAKLLPEKEKIKKTTKKKDRKKEEKAEKPAVIESPKAPKEGEGSAMEIPEDIERPEEEKKKEIEKSEPEITEELKEKETPKEEKPEEKKENPPADEKKI